jgi:alpha-tubulin suppressor-like RCC1 family protein
MIAADNDEPSDGVAAPLPLVEFIAMKRPRVSGDFDIDVSSTLVVERSPPVDGMTTKATTTSTITTTSPNASTGAKTHLPEKKEEGGGEEGLEGEGCDGSACFSMSSASLDFAEWPTDVTSDILSRLPLDSLPAVAAVCRAWRDAVDGDEHWKVRYLQRWQHPKTVGDWCPRWRSRFVCAHRVDGMLYVCGLRSAPGDDDGPTHVHGVEGRPVEADFYPAMSRRLRFAQAAPGAKHFLGVDSDGVLYAWGSPRGIRGSGVGGSQVHRASMGILPRIGRVISVPTEVPHCCVGPHMMILDEKNWRTLRAGDVKQIHIASNAEQKCAIVTKAGNLYYFGRRSCYLEECWIPSLMSVIDPFRAGRVRVASVALGDEHGLLVDIAGRVFSFGAGDLGQHGLGHVRTVAGHATLLDSLVEEGVVVVSIAAGMNHSLCLSSAGEVYAFGDGRRGQLGCDALCQLKPNRVLIQSADSASGTVVLSVITSVSAGFNLSAFVTTDGAVYTCGQQNEGGLGYWRKEVVDNNGVDTFELKFPQRVCDLAPHHVQCVSVGGGHMVALTADGLVFSWGNNDHGQCGRELSEEDRWLSGENRGCDDKGPQGFSVYDVAQVVLPSRVRFVSAGDTTTFFILGEPLRV